MKNKKSIVFFARDFLATEFSKISHDFSDFTRIYITVNKNEIEKASKFDVDGIYIDFQSFSIPNAYAPIQSDVSFNLDRYLRFYDTSEILPIANRLRSICEHLISNYDIAFYVDEPVSGYINSFFNNFFHSNGVQCLHFQTSWIPGYMFFVSDAAQHSPVKIDMLGSTEVVVGQHVERRKSGLARPLYVIDYSGYKKRISDLLTTTAKAVYRKIFRSTYLYIDKDPSAHFLHA
ncbi:MAG: hypothetical protein KGM99_00980, partial [Burkholderiales bacterium]|nr:hypothetical protein [Burkholderiales bacterium]